MLDFSFVEHAGTAVDYELVGAKVGRKFSSAGKLKLRLSFGVAANPGRKLNSANVATLTMVGTAFADENLVSVLNSIKLTHTFNGIIKITFITCYKNGE